ncbi:hypothetical protein FRACA_90002 [Frankia canadensis]|uniref:Acyl-CoA dehydrogenase/oxidase C-terminal domain-containing protein n=1 Tax=Frankia canadensis TaxID=1836972 RepID=A0A2I2L263_9ACTN|nr:acyl-CoA dehydrogenase family protein [Frankia canadensis]SNQ51999.1 hypothetical protein FRACA_90002 [Frankia canadensis]SOU59289.1 hypothetical protein FRACA_90002 [Frankia canadensis]
MATRNRHHQQTDITAAHDTCRSLQTKAMQIFEGTNQIQRMVIARHLARP